ncbi:Spy/CpxP family protein refolding chaperone [Arthrospiribacter ruber]|uniref:LTXXQ motif family protein n=1 Tax=Arthrospiribacter ruber TaxID=2487934 RepID=A0A951MD42_9BACT|nr:Spy/CpxP family protein refolding chaperone [Arthrospiribacter ruber]MBW3468177.1 hypothetical protein [Arthrospiribacter ruber]
MKKLSCIFLLVMLAGTVWAQKPERNYDKEKLESARVAFMTNRLDLKPEQSEKFWPVFNQYQEKRSALMDEISVLNHKSNQSLSDSEAKELISQRLMKQQQMLDLEKVFMDEVQKTISPSQAAKLHGINRQFTRQLYRMNQGRGRQGGKTP